MLPCMIARVARHSVKPIASEHVSRSLALALVITIVLSSCSDTSSSSKHFGTARHRGKNSLGFVSLTEPQGFAARTSEPAYAATAYLDGDERALIKRFLERRDALTAERRRELAAQIAGRIRGRVTPEMGRLADESLLERL
jgi:hypothetical protein